MSTIAISIPCVQGNLFCLQEHKERRWFSTAMTAHSSGRGAEVLVKRYECDTHSFLNNSGIENGVFFCPKILPWAKS